MVTSVRKTTKRMPSLFRSRTSLGRSSEIRPNLCLCPTSHAFLLAVISLVTFWLISLAALSVSLKDGQGLLRSQWTQAGSSISVDQVPPSYLANEHPLEPLPLSRIPGKCHATADVRGNLGPVDVVLQHHPGNDWIHDRWQAASNMHGKNIPGAHWILLEFVEPIVMDHIVLDWEAAYADLYRIEGSNDKEAFSPETGISNVNDGVEVVFDGMAGDAKEDLTKHRTVIERGQSPGVKSKTPLHVVHTIHDIGYHKPVKFVRLYIQKSAMGWGVSLWQFDVYGFWATNS